MHRRAFLRRTAAAVGVGALAGCTSSDDSRFTLSVNSVNITQTSDGYVAAEVTVTNSGDAAQSGVVYVTAELNGERSVELREVTLEPHSVTTVVVAYDVKYENMQSFSPSATVRRGDKGD